jgi:hypothetical protein
VEGEGGVGGVCLGHADGVRGREGLGEERDGLREGGREGERGVRDGSREGKGLKSP